MGYEVRRVGDHVVVVDKYNGFVCSADNEHEAWNDIQEMERCI